MTANDSSKARDSATDLFDEPNEAAVVAFQWNHHVMTRNACVQYGMTYYNTQMVRAVVYGTWIASIACYGKAIIHNLQRITTLLGRRCGIGCPAVLKHCRRTQSMMSVGNRNTNYRSELSRVLRREVYIKLGCIHVVTVLLHPFYYNSTSVGLFFRWLQVD